MGATQQVLLALGGGFTPLSIAGCVGWYDASDTSTISHSSNAVTQWRDKSTNAYQLAPNLSSERPLTNTDSQNGRNVVKFDGTDDEVFLQPVSIFKNIAGWTICVVAKTTTNSSANQQNIVTVMTGGTTTRGAITVQANPSNKLFGIGRRLDGDSSSSAIDSTAIGTSWFYAVFTGDYTNTDGTLYRNGSQVAVNNSWCTTGNSSNTDNQLSIGAFYGNGVTPSAYWQGDIAEVILYNSVLSTADRQLVEGYLASKWGL